MKSVFGGFSSANWYLKYVGLPVSVGMVIYALLSHVTSRRRRAALRGKVVVITGASSGIGEALAHVFHEQGCKVVLAARRKNELQRVKEDLQSKKLLIPSPEPVCIELDLAQFEQLDEFVQKVYSTCGEIDILINNGGVSHRGCILHSKIEVFKQIMNINYFGTIALTKAVLPKMVENKNGHIVFVSSVQGLIAIPDRAAYAASKHAVQAFGDSLRAEMKQHNINVTMISPGYVQTSISLNAFNAAGDKHGTMDTSTARGFSAEYCAENIMYTIANKETELVISQFVPKLAIFLRHFAPSLYHWFMTKRAEKTSLTTKL